MIVIPMAGESSRFFLAGYNVPKYMLKAHGFSLFHHSVVSFSKYFKSDRFLFILREEHNAKKFVVSECKEMGIDRFKIIVLRRSTKGQAETVSLALRELNIVNNESIIVFNIDTFRNNYIKPSRRNILEASGYLEVFKGVGDNWSYVLSNRNTTKVSLVAEKKQISDLCCTGLYYFNRASDFLYAYDHPLLPNSEAEKKERYIAPLYNTLIARGMNIQYSLINRNEVIFCGTPEEYEEYCLQ